MQQRVAIARALAYEPEVLLMDEPFGSLDALTRLELEDTLLRMWAELKTTILFITHDIEEAIYLSDRIWVLSRRPSQIMQRNRNRFSPAAQSGGDPRRSAIHGNPKRHLPPDPQRGWPRTCEIQLARLVGLRSFVVPLGARLARRAQAELYVPPISQSSVRSGSCVGRSDYAVMMITLGRF